MTRGRFISYKMEVSQKDLDKIESVKAKAKDLINDQAARALVDAESYTSRATSHQYASHENIEKAIVASRAAKDAVLEAKSSAIIKIDNIVKDIQVKV